MENFKSTEFSFNPVPSFDSTKQVLGEVNKAINQGSSDEELNMNFGKDLLNAMKEDAELLDLDKVIVNMPFKGICWCVNTKSIPNRFNPKMYDKIYTLISKNGTIFKVRLYSRTSDITEDNIEDSPVYISGIAIMPYEEIVFRVDHITIFDNLPLSLSCFIQELPEINEQIQKFNDIVNNLNSSSSKVFVSELDKNFNLIKNFRESAYKPFIGDKLGMKFLIFNSTIESIKAKNNLINYEDNKDIIILSLITYLTKVHIEENMKNSYADNITYLISHIFNSALNSDIKLELIKILSDGRTDNSFVSIMFSDLKIIENILRR